MSPSTPQHIGPYRVERSLGQGGMGRVFLVSKGLAPFEARFAMKRMHHGEMDDATTKALFRQETKVLSGLTHRNIVRAVDFDEDESGASYLVMEYVDGPSLKQLAHHSQLPLSLIVHIATELCRGLAYCHDFARNRHLAEIVHRDIKPENILIAADGTVKLADFGIAKFRGRESHTATNQFRGTPWYMSPEHMDPDQVPDHRSDLFSLGVVLYELLTTVNPFRRERASSAEHAIKAILIDGHFTPLEQRVSILEPELCTLVNSLLQRDPKLRPQSAQDALQTLLRLPQRVDAPELLVEFVRSASLALDDDKLRSPTHSLLAGMVEVTPPPMLDDEGADALEESGSFDPALAGGTFGHHPDYADDDEDDEDDEDTPPPSSRFVRAGPREGSGPATALPLDGPRAGIDTPRTPRTYPTRPPAAKRARQATGWPWLRIVLAGLVFASITVAWSRFAPGAASPPKTLQSAAPNPQIDTQIAAAAAPQREPEVMPLAPVPPPRDPREPAAPAQAESVTPKSQSADAGSATPPREATANTNESDTEPDNVPNQERRSRHGGDERLARLNVVVYPWGYIWVDGRYYGESPADLTGLKPGSHAVGLSQSSEKPARIERVRLKPGPNNLEYHLH